MTHTMLYNRALRMIHAQRDQRMKDLLVRAVADIFQEKHFDVKLDAQRLAERERQLPV